MGDTRARRCSAGISVLVLIVILAGCRERSGGGDPTQPTPNQPPPSAISQTAKSFLDLLLDTLQRYSVNQASIDWTDFRTQVVTAAGPAQTIPDTYPAIAIALPLLGDGESYYQPAFGALIGPAPVGGCGAAHATPVLPDTIGYVRIESCDCQGTAANEFAESIQRAIRAADRSGLKGWIVDLRGNFGGNMWPMIAGVGPVLGEGIIGWIVYNDREYEREYRAGGAQSFGEVFASVAQPYTLLRQDLRVAVLTDGGVVSAAEAITVFFKGRPDTRSFGTPTCGHHHLQQPFRVGNGTLNLVTAQSADRTKTRYSGSVAPDEIVTDSEAAVTRAIAWLQEGR